MQVENSAVLNLAITGAAGQISYSLYNLIGNGNVFGENQKIELRLIDLESQLGVLEGIKLELEDCAYSLVENIRVGHDSNELFKDVDFVIFLGGYPRKPGMERKDLLQINNSIFKQQGEALNNVAKKTCKSIVVANPANTNCLTLANHCPSIPKENFTCLTRLDQNRGNANLAEKLGTSIRSIKNVIIWGNHSATQYPDVTYAKFNGQPIRDHIQTQYLEEEFITRIQRRGAEIIKARGGSSVMSAANAVKDHIKSWVFGTKEDEIISMGVYIQNDIGKEYGIPNNIVSSIPLTCQNQQWKIVSGLSISEFSKEKISLTIQELQEEKADSMSQN